MSIKKEDRAFLEESLRAHIAKGKDFLEDAVEGVCLRGKEGDLAVLELAEKNYRGLLRAQMLLADICA